MTYASEVQYTRTDSGVSIAYSVSGTGPYLIHLPLMVGNVMEEMEIPPLREWYELLSEHFTLIRFDRRTQGLSQREGFEPDVAAEYDDVIAVLRALNVKRTHVLAPPGSQFLATKLAVTDREIVESLIVLSQGSFQDPAVSVLMATSEESWPVNSAFYALWTVGWTEPLIGLRYSELVHGSARVADLIRRMGYIAGAGSEEYQENRRSASAPVLILAGRPRTERWAKDRETIAEEARRAASEYKRPTLKLIEDSLIMPGHTETRRHALVEAIVSFTRSLGRTEPSENTVDAAPSPFQSIMFTDLEASTALTQRLGDEGAQELLHEHNDAVREALGEHGGREVKHTGDGIMASFPSAVAAVASALQIQRDMEGAEVRVRVGLNAGEPIAEDDDLFGTAVQMAARITDRADPGQVLVSRVVADLCAGKSYNFASVGVATMKGFDEPVELFEVTY